MSYLAKDLRILIDATAVEDISGEITEINLVASASVASRELVGRNSLWKAVTSLDGSVDLSGYTIDALATAQIERAFRDSESARILVYHTVSRQFAVADYLIASIGIENADGVLVLNGEAQRNGGVIVGEVYGSTAPTSIVTAAAPILLYCQPATGGGVASITYTPTSAAGAHAAALAAGSQRIQLVEPLKSGARAPAAVGAGRITAFAGIATAIYGLGHWMEID